MADSGIAYEILRPAGTSERRCIMRHALDYYRALIVTGRYILPSGFVLKKKSFYPALTACISRHAMLSAAIKGEQTEAPEFIRPAILDLSNHVDIAEPIIAAGPSMHTELEALRPRLCDAHDQRFPNVDRVPPWKIIVVPVSNAARTARSCWILFSYSHSHGDGPSGLSFHRALLHALRDSSITSPTSSSSSDPIITPPRKPLLPPVELTAPLPITWSFFLLPVVSAHLPARLSALLPSFFRASVTPQTPDMWAALPTTHPSSSSSSSSSAFRTGVRFAIADARTLSALLHKCRAHDAKLTGALHNLVVRALSAALPADAPAGSFVAQTAIDLRRLMPAAGGGDGEEREDWRGAFGLGVSVAYHAFPRVVEEDEEEGEGERLGDEAFWARARETTAHLAERAGTLVDQPIGLLRYLRSYRAWLEGLVGKARDASYEVSNIMAFDPEGPAGGRLAVGAGDQEEGGWKIDAMVFSQPANATGTPVNFNVVSTKGGDMVVSLTWQRGVLGVEGDEDEWARGVCGKLERDMRVLAEAK